MTDPLASLTPLQKAAVTIKSLRARVDAAERERSEPIAIVGMACRLPARSVSPDALWEALRNGAIGSMPVPGERWDVAEVYDPEPGKPGKMYVSKACFIEDVERFDPLFFRISPREAIGIDPQQRLLLEVVHEALEDAGLPPPSLVGSRTGVFLGISTNDYSALLSRSAHGSGSNAAAGAGNAASVASGRISYTFGLQGPCFAVDTACSSSLVTTHLAVQSLRNGESDIALVAGVNLMLTPDITINFCQGRMLSPDGLCKSFDAGADGYVRGEGCGVVVLKRLADARAAGDRVIALISGSAINQDGKSAGLTAPNGAAQVAVIRQALANAGLGPDAIDFIEAHGTGTALGDPIEMHALRNVFEGRQRPLGVGSVKSSIGHTEAAAGVSGLIKAALMLREQAVPPHPCFERLNQHIELGDLPVQIARHASRVPLQHIGVSSFGFSGTNAHVIVSAAPSSEAPSQPVDALAGTDVGESQLLISAQSESALRELIARYQDVLQRTDVVFADVCHSAQVERARYKWWVLVRSPDELASASPSNAAPPAIGPQRGRRVALPKTPFERRRYWVDTAASSPPAVATAAAMVAATGSLMPRRLDLPLSSEQRFECLLDIGLDGLAFLAGHVVAGEVLLPAAAMLEIVLRACPEQEVRDIVLHAPLRLPAGEARAVQLICAADAGFKLVSFAPEQPAQASLHASGRLAALASGETLAPDTPNGRAIAHHDFYRAMADYGVAYAEPFQRLREIRAEAGQASAQLLAGDSAEGGLTTAIDAALQLVAVALPEHAEALLLPARIARVQLLRLPRGDARVQVRAQRIAAGVEAEVCVFDAQGLALRLRGVQFHAAAQRALHGLYRIDWCRQDLPGSLAQDFPGAQALAAELVAAQPAPSAAVGDYALAEQALNRLATCYVALALSRLGLPFQPGQEFSLGALQESLGIVARQQRLFAHLLGFLVEDGVLERRGRRWRVLAAPELSGEPGERLAEQFPAMAGEIAVLKRCGGALAEVLQGSTDPLQLLFGSADSGAGSFYSGSAYADTVNAQVRQAIAALPVGAAPLRALEVGGGTGGTTRAVLQALDGRALDYCFTDISPAFLSAARQQFERPGFSTRRLDIESDPLAQGFAPAGADVVLAANVLHATRDIGQSLAHARSLLAPGGLLILVESTQARRWVDIVFGLTEGWWRFEDHALRPSHPLLGHQQWREALQAAGFEPGVVDGLDVILARAPLQPLDAGEAVALSGAEAEAVAAQLTAAGCQPVAPGSEQHRIHLLAPTACEEQAQVELYLSLCRLVEDLTRRERPPRLTLVGRTDAGHGGLAGFVRSLRLEHPACRPRLILADTITPELLRDAVAHDEEEEVRYRDGQRLVARLAAAADPTPPRVSGTWLISGGSGGLGRAIATQLATLGAERLVLIGRRVPQDLPEPGIPCSFHAGDVADPQFLAALLAEVGELGGVVHAAGLLANAPIPAQTEATAARVLHAKIGGALNLIQALRGRRFQYLVLFASAAGVLGSARQSNHAFASSLLDALAEQARRDGVPALALDWGVWRDIGAAARLGFDAQAEELGLGSIAPPQGLAAFAAALGSATSQLLVTPGADYARFAAHFQPRPPRLYADLCAAPTAAVGSPPPPTAPQDMPALRPAPAHATRDGLARIVAELLQVDRPIDPALPLFEYGLDSLVAVEIKRRAEQELGLQIAVRDLIEGASIAQLTASETAAEAQQATTPAAAQAEPAVERLYAIIAELLSLPGPPDPDTPLFEYGLDSLVAVEIKNRVEKELGVALQVRDLIEGASASALARALGPAAETLAQPAAAIARRRIEPELAARHQPFPLTEIQQAYWLGSRDDMSLGSVGCYLYTEFDTSEVDLERLERAWNQLVQRHDMLRLVISADGQQRILAEVPPYRFARHDLRGLPEMEVEDGLLRIRERLSARIAAPESWPLFDISISLHGDTARIHTGFDLIALDAASIHALRLEWAALYDDPAAALAPIGLSFRDVVLESLQHRHSDAFALSQAYWRERLDSLPGAPDLPLLDRPAGGTPRFRRHRIVLVREAADRLKAACRARRLTLAGVLAAAYADILASWSRDPRFALTVTSFNRPDLHPDIGALLGDFTSTLLLEVDARAPGFEQRARTLAERLAADLDHADVGGVEVLRERSRRQGGGLQSVPVVFTSALGFRAAGSGAPRSESAGWDRLGTTVYSVSSTPQVWIDHQISEEDGQLFCNWDVLDGVFPEGVVEAMTDAHSRLLNSLADGPGWDWPPRQALAPPRRAPLLPTPAPEMLHQRFRRLARLQPDALALVCGERRLSYAELESAATRLAARLIEALGGADASRDRRVAVCLEKGPEQVVGVLGIVMAGAAYLPIDPAWPAQRQQDLLQESGALELQREWVVDAMQPGAPAPLPDFDDPDRLAYVIYTSGSTGQPKGVMIEHRAAFATIEAVNRRWRVGPQDRCLALSALSFDLSVYDLFGTLSAGAAVVLPPASATPDPAAWAKALVGGEVTLWNSAPALMALMLEHGLPHGHALRLILLSGDWISLETVAALREQAPAAQLVCLGGATEAAIWSNFHEVGELDPAWRSIPYGTPLDGQMLHIVDRQGRELPDHCIGDIEISGAGLARGYLGDAQRTGERFRHDPISGQRRYRTGDIGRHRPYGTGPQAAVPIEFLGREDFQIKLQGHRIELGEIEAVLEQHPQVAQAVVNAFAPVPGAERQLAAFVVPSTPGAARLPLAAALQAAQEEAVCSATGFDVEAFDRMVDFLTRQTAVTVAQACRALAGSEELPSAEQLIERHGVASRYRDWLARTLPLAAAHGGGDCEPQSIRQLPEPDFFDLGLGQLDLFDQSLASLPDILTERRHSADIYLSEQTPEVYGRLFEAPHRIIARLLASLSGEGPLRILEVGGGLGTSLGQLAECLERSGARYRFTDASQAMVNLARRRFGERPWLEYGVLDMQAAPPPDAERYDVVLATSALHVASDAVEALRALRQWLKPGGVLIALEQTRFFPWYDLSMGLQSGFDGRTDRQLRPQHPLLAREAWRELMLQAGFGRVEPVLASGSLTEHLGFDVLLAQNPDGGAQGEALSESALRQWLAARLPAYMVPRRVELLSRLPLSANGKLDRGALRPSARSEGAAPPPDDALQGEVSALVAACLGIDAVDPARSLFELGATSLSLVALQRRVGERFGRSIPLQALFEQPTLHNLVELIRGDAAPTSPVIRFASDGLSEQAPRLFMMPGILALPFYLRDLAAVLRPDLELVSVQLPGLFGDERPLDRIEDQVDYVLARIRQFQPRGPYLIAGHSFGGTIAFEAARRLREAGEQVPLLVLVDTVRTRSQLQAFQRDEVVQLAMLRALLALYGDRLAFDPGPLTLENAADALQRLTAELQEQQVFGPIALPLQRMAAMFKANFHALGQFQASPLPGDMVLIRSAEGFPAEFAEHEPAASLDDPGRGWSDRVKGQLRLDSVPGDHLSLMSAGTLEATADVLRRRVREALQRPIPDPAAGASGSARIMLPANPCRPRRRSVRRYLNGASLDLAHLGGLLDAVAAIQDPAGPLHHYPSAGGLYPVRIWLQLACDCGQAPAGLYAYDRVRHELDLVEAGVPLPLAAQAEINRAMVAQAAFALYLVVDLPVIEPSYGLLARDFGLIEAGAMTQLLMEWAEGLGLGLCPIGGFDPQGLAGALELGDARFLALTLVGGVAA